MINPLDMTDQYQKTLAGDEDPEEHRMDGYCKECEQWVEAIRVPDSVDFCPECRTVDNIDFDREKEDE